MLRKNGLPEEEHIISRSPKWSMRYASNILKRRRNESEGRPEKEQVIGQDPEWSYWYAFHVIKGHWSLEDDRKEKNRSFPGIQNGRPIEDNRAEKENVISRESMWSYWYTHEVINRYLS